MPKITVLCADAFVHTALRSELAATTEIELIDVAMKSEQRLLELAFDLKPDVLLVNGDLDYVTLVTALRLGCPSAKAIVFHENCGRREAIEAIASGAKGCLQKNSNPASWERAIRMVSLGHIWLARQLLVESLDWLLRHNHREFVLESKPKQLTAREWEVVHWVSQGMTNKEIARKLDISDTTVKTHLQHIFSKLSIRRRLQLPVA